MSALAVEVPPVYALEIAQPDETAAYRARHWLTWLLELAEVAQDTIHAAILAASELVTNAVVHAGGRVLVSAELLQAGVRLSVHDSVPAADWQSAGGEEDENGRGLLIVQAIADEFDIAITADGTTVSALIR